VIEMDAASHNGVDDVRQINDAIRYAPVSARYKVYILDEVHMLSGAAFNALLKTLEEPPPHAKFIFATTEIRKVPVTVLSRCQRFDLRRVDAGVLIQHLEGIAAKEKVEIEPAALALVARASEGSVRDSLSLLDQAIAHAAGPVRAEDVRQMLGLADRVRIVDLFESLMKGDAASALKELREQYDIGADPAVVLSDLAEFTHFVTRAKVVPAVADDVSLSEAERVRGRDFAAQLSMRVLSRTWQMLLKGVGEVQASNRPVAAAEMVLVRIAYAADLPTPDEVVRSLSGDGSGASAPQGGGNGRGAPAPASSQSFAPRFDAPRGAPRASAAVSPRMSADPAPREEAAPQVLTLDSFAALIALAQEKRDVTMKMTLERDVRLVRCEDGKLELALEKSAPRTLINDLSRKLQDWTGKRWMVVISKEQGAPPVRLQQEARQAEVERGVHSDPLVKAVLDRFPGAKVVNVTQAPSDAAFDGVPPEPEQED
jgi:DNA polymerase-3 subunit gamma/tau